MILKFFTFYFLLLTNLTAHPLEKDEVTNLIGTKINILLDINIPPSSTSFEIGTMSLKHERTTRKAQRTESITCFLHVDRSKLDPKDQIADILVKSKENAYTVATIDKSVEPFPVRGIDMMDSIRTYKFNFENPNVVIGLFCIAYEIKYDWRHKEVIGYYPRDLTVSDLRKVLNRGKDLSFGFGDPIVVD